jgi:hypothetical protein
MNTTPQGDAAASGSDVEVVVADSGDTGSNDPGANAGGGGANGRQPNGSRSGRIGTLTYRLRESERQRKSTEASLLQMGHRVSALSARLEGDDSRRSAEAELRQHEEHRTSQDRRVKDAAAVLAKAEYEGDADLIGSAREDHILAVAERRAIDADLAHRRNELAVNTAAAAPKATPAPTKTAEVGFSLWREDNPWFDKDPAMTKTAMGVHNRLKEGGKVKIGSQDYYRQIDAEMGKKHGDSPYMQDDFDPGKPAADPAPGPQYAGAGDAPAGAGRRTVRLTADQVRTAERMGVPVAEYAKNVLKGQNK